MSIGQRLRARRTDLGLGLREAARAIGISPTFLSRIETKGESPSEDVLRRLAALLGEDFDDLMCLAGRIAEDVRQVILSDPQMPAFLRAAAACGLTGADLLRLLDQFQAPARKRG